MGSLKDYEAAAKKLGFALYPWQKQVLDYGVDGGDLIMIVKTSGGKTLIYADLIAIGILPGHSCI